MVSRYSLKQWRESLRSPSNKMYDYLIKLKANATILSDKKQMLKQLMRKGLRIRYFITIAVSCQHVCAHTHFTQNQSTGKKIAGITCKEMKNKKIPGRFSIIVSDYCHITSKLLPNLLRSREFTEKKKILEKLKKKTWWHMSSQYENDIMLDFAVEFVYFAKIQERFINGKKIKLSSFAVNFSSHYSICRVIKMLHSSLNAFQNFFNYQNSHTQEMKVQKPFIKL